MHKQACDGQLAPNHLQGLAEYKAVSPCSILGAQALFTHVEDLQAQATSAQ